MPITPERREYLRNYMREVRTDPLTREKYAEINRRYMRKKRLDPAFRPTASLHSRAHGRRHGVTSCLTVGKRLFFAAKGDGVVASRTYEGLTS